MKVTLNLDERLLASAREATGITDDARLVNEALEALVKMKAGNRETASKSKEPHIGSSTRFRPEDFIHDTD